MTPEEVVVRMMNKRLEQFAMGMEMMANRRQTSPLEFTAVVTLLVKVAMLGDQQRFTMNALEHLLELGLLGVDYPDEDLVRMKMDSELIRLIGQCVCGDAPACQCGGCQLHCSC